MAIGIPSLTGSTDSTSSSTSYSYNLSANLVANNLHFVGVGYDNVNGGSVSSVGDTVNTYAKVVGIKNGNGGCELWASQGIGAVSSGTAVTVHFSAATAQVVIAGGQCSGIATSGAVDQTNSGTSPPVSSGTLNQPSELVLGLEGGYNFTGCSESSGFTNLYEFAIPVNEILLNIGYVVVSSNASVSYNPSPVGSGGNGVTLIASFFGGSPVATGEYSNPIFKVNRGHRSFRQFCSLKSGIVVPERKVVVPGRRIFVPSKGVGKCPSITI